MKPPFAFAYDPLVPQKFRKSRLFEGRIQGFLNFWGTLGCPRVRIGAARGAWEAGQGGPGGCLDRIRAAGVPGRRAGVAGRAWEGAREAGQGGWEGSGGAWEAGQVAPEGAWEAGMEAREEAWEAGQVAWRVPGVPVLGYPSTGS